MLWEWRWGGSGAASLWRTHGSKRSKQPSLVGRLNKSCIDRKDIENLTTAGAVVLSLGMLGFNLSRIWRSTKGHTSSERQYLIGAVPEQSMQVRQLNYYYQQNSKS